MKPLIKNRIVGLVLFASILITLAGCADSSNNFNGSTGVNIKNSYEQNADYYINSKGNKVHSPVYSSTVPSGATAKCKDDIYKKMS